MAVELWESNTIPEGIHARVLRHNARQRPPSSIEVPAKRDVIFSAIGGAGEAGNVGGDGQSGMDGIDGRPATREIDATVRPFLIIRPIRSNTIAILRSTSAYADVRIAWYRRRERWRVGNLSLLLICSHRHHQ